LELTFTHFTARSFRKLGTNGQKMLTVHCRVLYSTSEILFHTVLSHRRALPFASYFKFLYIRILTVTTNLVSCLLLTPWSRIPLQNVATTQLLKKLITIFTISHHVILRQSMPSHRLFTSITHFNNILSAMPVSPQVVSSRQEFATKILYAFLTTHTCYMSRPSHSPPPPI
jgi:hypothetical protein